MFLYFLLKPLTLIDPPICLPNALLEGGRGEVNLPLNTEQIQNPEFRGYLCSNVAMY